MRAGLSLLQGKGLALAGARFRAWWDGVEFDEDAYESARQPVLAEAVGNNGEDADDALFEEAKLRRDARFAALELLWGEGRGAPGDEEDEAALIGKLAASSTGSILVMGANFAAPLAALAKAHRGKIKAYEWREEVMPALAVARAAGLLEDRIETVAFDLDATPLPEGVFDGVISCDEFTYVDHAPRLGLQIARALKRGARAVLDAYVCAPGDDLSPAFATSFSEQRIQTIDAMRAAVVETGLEIKAEEDLTDETLRLAKAAFAAMKERMEDERWQKPPIAVARELAWELESWKVRLALLSTRRLERRRLIVRR